MTQKKLLGHIVADYNGNMTDTFNDCPACGMSNTYLDSNLWVCPDCCHEWTPETFNNESIPTAPCKDANGNILNNGDAVILIKDLKVKGSSLTIKGGTKIKNIRIVEGEHDIDCKINGQNLMLKSVFLKKI